MNENKLGTMPFTVLLYYSYYGEDVETYLAHVFASDPTNAVKWAQQKQFAENHGKELTETFSDIQAELENLIPLLVIEGHHNDLLE